MDPRQIAGIVLIVAGALALAYGGFGYTSDTHDLELGSLQISVDEKEYINVPMWAGIGAIVIGGVLLVWRRKN